MENWKERSDDEGRSFVEFVKEVEEKIICVACSKPIADKVDLKVIEDIYSHTRSIEHGFKMFVMINVDQFEVVDLTNCDNRENWSPKPKQTNVEITRNADGTLKIAGVNPIKYVIPIIDLPFIKPDTSPRKTALMSLDNYVTRKRKQSEEGTEQNSLVSSTKQKRKTSQLTLQRWVKKDENQLLNPFFVESPQNTPQQQEQSDIQTSSSLSEGLTPISEVRPAKRGISQIIRARVAIKSDVHPLCSFLGPTTMFMMNLVDESGEIGLSGFGENVNKFYDLVEVGRIYYFSKFRVKPTDPSKTPIISEYSITCTEHTIIRPCLLTPLEFPRLGFDFEPISKVQNLKKDEVIDVIAIIEQIGDVQHKKLSGGTAGRNRGIWLVDQSKAKILLFLWGSNADNFETNRPGDVIAVKRAKVKTYAKLNLDSSCLSCSTFEINPQMPEADDLRKWYYQNGKTASHKVLSSLPRLKKISASSIR